MVKKHREFSSDDVKPWPVTRPTWGHYAVLVGEVLLLLTVCLLLYSMTVGLLESS